MFQNKPKLAKKWTEKYGSKPNLNNTIKKAKKK